MSRKNNKDKAKNRQGNASAKHYATIVAQRLRRIPKKVWWAMAFLVAVAYSWVFYSYFVEPSGFRWRALYGDPKYPDTDGLHGCDISHHQGVIDWSRLRNAMVNRKPVQFVMIKATAHSREKMTNNTVMRIEGIFIRTHPPLRWKPAGLSFRPAGVVKTQR